MLRSIPTGIITCTIAALAIGPLADRCVGAEYPLASSKPTGKPAPAQQPPNILLIISDDHHWADYSFLGHAVARTPNLDRLASQSAVFTKGYVPTSLCSPSLATILTGLYPRQHGITGNDPAIPPGWDNPSPRRNPQYIELIERYNAQIDSVDTLPRLLRTKGYVSFQSGKWWLGSYRQGGFTHGMTHGDLSRGGRHGDDGLAIGRQGLKPIMDFVSEHHRPDKPTAPFLIWYAPFLPHTPHNPPKKYLDHYTAQDRPLALAKYYAMCEWFDDTCGQLLNYLDDHDLAGNTIVIYLSDNGWIQRTGDTPVPSGWTRGFAPRSKQSPYEGGIRTPLMIRWPGRVKPGLQDSLASSVDIAPTILEAVGLQPPSAMPGRNLIAIAGGLQQPRDLVRGEIFAHDAADIQDPDASLIYTWCRDDRWKLIKTHPGKTGRYGSMHPQTSAPLELYDLVRDPEERNNLSRSHPQIVARLDQAMRR